MSERLENGWGPDAAPGDNLLQTVLNSFAASSLQWVEANGGRWERLPELVLADMASPCLYFNIATPLRPILDAGDPLLGEIDRFFCGAVGPASVWCAWPTPDLSQRGWKLLDYPPAMLLPRGAVAPPTSLDIRELEGDRGAAILERIMVDGFPLPELQPYRQGSVFDGRALRSGMRAWAAYVDDVPVGISAANVHDGITLVEWVATMPEFRGRGIGTALTWVAATIEPGHHAYLHSSDDGRPIYERMGFIPLFRFTLWEIPASPPPAKGR